MAGNHLKSVIVKKLSIPKRQQKIIFTVAFILLAIDAILSTFTLSISDIVTIRANKSISKFSQLESDDDSGQQLEVGKIYEKRNQRIREVCKKVKTTRPVFVNNRKKILPMSYWLKNRTNTCSLGKNIISEIAIFTFLLFGYTSFIQYLNFTDIMYDEDYDEDAIMNTEMPNTSHFYISRAFRSMGCFPNKVASSSLLAAFLTERGLKPTSYASPHSVGILLQPKVCMYNPTVY